MTNFQTDTLTNLHDMLCKHIVHAGEDELDVITSVDVQIHNAMAQCSSMEWEFNLKNMWLTPSRWTMMANQYIDPDELKAWIEQVASKLGTKGRGIAMMRTKTVKPRGGPAQGNKETRRWGSCMLAISYKAVPRPQITLYSRTSYLGYLGALDLSIAWMCGRYIAKAVGIEVEDLAFTWYNEALQYHNFKSLAYLLNHPDEERRELYRKFLMKKKLKPKFEEKHASPALLLSRNWMQNMMAMDVPGDGFQTLGDMNYNTYRRIRRRFHTEVLGYEQAQKFEGWSYYKVGEKKGEEKEFFKAYLPLPDTMIENLDFRRLGLPLDGLAEVDYDGGYDDDADEDSDD